MDSKVTLEINGETIEASPNKTILEVVRENDLDDIPTLCHSPKLEPYGSCFLCVVEIDGQDNLTPSCCTPVNDGMEVQTNNERIRATRKMALDLLLSNHYADCLPPCHHECPAGVDIQGYVSLVNHGKYEEAIRLIKEANPLPIACGRVCVRYCETKCRRGIIDDPVAINFIKRYATDITMGKTIVAEQKEPKSERIAIIGGGPAGLSAAYYLAVEGYNVTIYEEKPELGGMLRYGIPEFRLPRDVLDGEINQIMSLGVEANTNSKLGKDFSLEELQEEGYDSIFLAFGAWSPSSMYVEGEWETEGVITGLEYLASQELSGGKDLHGKVLVVGGGNTAIDTARTAIRSDADEVILLYRRSRKQMPADEEEVEAAEEEGVELQFLTQPKNLITDDDGRLKALECIEMRLGEKDSSGRRKPIPVEDSKFEVECDFVLSAVGQSVKGSTVEEGIEKGKEESELEFTDWDTIITDDDTMETAKEGVFAGGDVVTGPMAVIDAIAMGRKASNSIITYLQEGEAKALPEPFVSRKDAFGEVTEDELPDDYEETERAEMPEIPPEERIKSEEEVQQGISQEQVIEESLRCLECGCQVFYDCSLQEEGTNYDADIQHVMGEVQKYDEDLRHPLITLDPNKCILCHKCIGTCERMLGNSALGLVNRGFKTVVKAALEKPLQETECNSCGNCVDACPTGAIISKAPYDKPGPWVSQKLESVCNYCSVGCNINYEHATEGLLHVTGDHESFEAPNEGELCVKGRFGYSYITHDNRLESPQVKEEGAFQQVDWDEALENIADNITDYDPEEIAILGSPKLSTEEAFLLQKLALEGFETSNVGSLTLQNMSDEELNEVLGFTGSTTTLEEISNADTIVVVNSDPFTENFIAGQKILEAAKGDDTKLITITPQKTQLSEYADIEIEPDKGEAAATLSKIMTSVIENNQYADDYIEENTEGFLALKESLADIEGDFEDVAEEFGDPDKNIVAVSSRDSEYMEEGLLKTLGNLLLLTGKCITESNGLLLLSRHSNSLGVSNVGLSSDSQLLDKLEAGKIKAAFVIGEDPAAVDPDLLENIEYLAVSDFFMSDTAQQADVILPQSAYVESSGHFFNFERRVREFDQIDEPYTDKVNWEALAQLLSLTGVSSDYSSPDEIFDEIKSVLEKFELADKQDYLWGEPTDVTFKTVDSKGHFTPVPVENTDRINYTEYESLERWFAKIRKQKGLNTLL